MDNDLLYLFDNFSDSDLIESKKKTNKIAETANSSKPQENNQEAVKNEVATQRNKPKKQRKASSIDIFSELKNTEEYKSFCSIISQYLVKDNSLANDSEEELEKNFQELLVIIQTIDTVKLYGTRIKRSIKAFPLLKDSYQNKIQNTLNTLPLWKTPQEFICTAYSVDIETATIIYDAFIVTVAKYEKIIASNSKTLQKAQGNKLNTDIPKTHILLDSAVNTFLRGKHILGSNEKFPVIETGEFSLKTFHETKKFPDPTIRVMFDYDNKPDTIKFEGGKIEEYDQQVSDAVCSILYSGCTVMTAQTILNAMVGEKLSHASATQLNDIENSMRKFRSLLCTIDATQEFSARGIETNDKAVYRRRPYFYYEEWQVVSPNGTSVSGYHFRDIPPLLEYAEKVKGLRYTEPKIYSIKKIEKGQISSHTLVNTKNRIVIKGFLIRRIILIKLKNWNSTISIDTILNEITENNVPVTLSYNERKRLSDYISQCLEYWAKIRFIDSYSMTNTEIKISAKTFIEEIR